MGTDTEKYPVLYFYDCVNFIMSKTGFTIDMINEVLDAESEYMMKCGILEIDDCK